MDLGRKQFSTEFAGRPLSIEISRLAEQADAAVLARYGDNAVLVTAVMGTVDKPVNYFPLVVDYEERFYAAGKIIGSRFIRREGRASEEAVLSGRLIDRTIRPLFDHRMRREVQVVVTILSTDEETDLDFITLLAASTALAISPIPWAGPVAGVKLLTRKGSDEILVNPTNTACRENFESILFAAGDAEHINMIEMEGREAPEENLATLFPRAQNEIQKLIAWQNAVIREVGAKKIAVPLIEAPHEFLTAAKAFLKKDKLESAVFAKDKMKREENLAKLSLDLRAHLIEAGFEEKSLSGAEHILEDKIDSLVHEKALTENVRPDGRAMDEVRDLHGEVALFPRNHGSALFIRGNTQALAVTTLGPPNAEQLIETMEVTGKRRFLLHYNFPSYSVGEIGPFRGPGRREIGHGALAGKALRNLMPSSDVFPYTIRVVSEILSSNGSSSMATVCAASLSLMDAGVPFPKAVAGIAMGLMVDQQPTTNNQQPKYKILTDIQGPEDHFGDMDCKVAGTRDGVTAMQMDVKIRGITPKMIGEVLMQARRARLHILSAMEKTLAAPRDHLSPYAPILLQIQVPPDRIGEVIGPGGKIINGIIERTGALAIDIEDDGRTVVSASSREKAEAALAEIKAIIKEYALGEIVEGKVVKILDFGAIVQFDPHHDGMVHVSELKDGYVKRVEDVLKMGDFVRAKIVKLDPDGRIGLSLKRLTSPTN